MDRSRRLVLLFLLTAIVLFIGLLFWPFIERNIIQPTAMVIWFLLRILVLSIHQRYFWVAIIFAAFLVLFRILYQAQSAPQPSAFLETNTTLINIGYWRGLFMYSGQDVQEDKNLKRQLIYLLTSLYASKQGTLNDFRIQDAMRQGTIPLPGKIHAFLFPQEPVSGGPLQKFFQSIRQTPRSWIRQWTGQEKAEHYQMIEEVLNFLEASLEIKHDDRKLTQDKH